MEEKGRAKVGERQPQHEDAVPTEEEIVAAFSEEPCPSNKPSKDQLSEIAEVFGQEFAQEIQDQPIITTEVDSICFNIPVPEGRP